MGTPAAFGVRTRRGPAGGVISSHTADAPSLDRLAAAVSRGDAERRRTRGARARPRLRRASCGRRRRGAGPGAGRAAARTRTASYSGGSPGDQWGRKVSGKRRGDAASRSRKPGNAVGRAYVTGPRTALERPLRASNPQPKPAGSQLRRGFTGRLSRLGGMHGRSRLPATELLSDQLSNQLQRRRPHRQNDTKTQPGQQSPADQRPLAKPCTPAETSRQNTEYQILLHSVQLP